MSNKLSDNGVIAAEDLFYLLGGKEKIKLLDATYSLPQSGMSPSDAFLAQHIAGAQYFDIDVVADQEAPLPHTLPSPEYFASCVSAMGISNRDHVVIYDQSGAYMASSRAWWMFRVFGHENVYVLEGGLAAWRQGGFPTASGPAEPPEKTTEFKSALRADLIVSKTDLLNNIDTNVMTVIDARPPARFAGQTPEPWAGKRAGHIPGSINLPFGELINPASRHFKDKDVLDNILANVPAQANDRLAATCGSGVTACTIALALYKLRRQDCAVYDGSWSEWGDEAAGTPIEVSA